MDLIVNDPYVYKDRIRASTGIAIVRAEKYIMENAGNLVTPYLLYHGERDRIVTASTSKLFDSLATKVKNKKLTIIPNGEHDAVYRPEKIEGIASEVADWILKLA
eukprot:TRINITY_DN1953_c0_g1_i10.p2 TRINITY_DN1953_c0_g1~~TRINITY_DN1953_c0_g1_i10.p2  ORF type:complete len:105 (+),score=32.45 TRINITY_DN1953_c0_g1_i10:839-1153(+)